MNRSSRHKSRFFSQKKNKNRSNNEKFPIFSATVRDLTSDGRGVVSDENGLTVFVEGVWLGEAGKFRITKKQKRIGIGELIELEKASPHRIIPICPHHGFSEKHCGGCAWQFIDYSQQLLAKQDRVEQAIKRFSDCKISAIQPASETTGYRNRAQLKTDGEQLGYVAKSTHSIVTIEQCPVLSQHNQNTLTTLLNQLPNTDWTPKTRQQWVTLNIDDNVTAETVSIDQRLPFQQSNHTQNNFMKTWLKDQLSQIDKPSRVLELFCGSGNFTEVMVENNIGEIVAIDGAGDAIQSLQKKYPQITTASMNLFDEDIFQRIYQRYEKFDTLVLDPPRDGLKNHAHLLTRKNRFKNIFYISCDLATFSRDAKFFTEQGFELVTLQPLDQLLGNIKVANKTI